jgi:hypothetical protein
MKLRRYRLLRCLLSVSTFAASLSMPTLVCAQQFESWPSSANSSCSDPDLAVGDNSHNFLGATATQVVAATSGVVKVSAGTVPSIRPVTTTVEVDADAQTVRDGLAVPYHVTQAEVLSSAGTFEDFTRYLQVLPGVAWNSDISNDVMVRGGHPSENLYVVDGIEVPNINHLAVEGTTGGFTSMIDTSSISSVDLNSGIYDASYSSRLSSMIEIHTRESEKGAPDSELNFGIGGVGGFSDLPLGNQGSILVSAHRSLLNLMADNIGIDGTPTYTDGLARVQWSPSQKDHISALSLNGADSIDVTPCAGDPYESLLVDTQYGGGRSTQGMVWQHIHSPTVVSTLSGSYSFDDQSIAQQQQNPGASENSWATGVYCQPTELTQIYRERTHDGMSAVSYRVQFGLHSWLFSTGGTGRVTRLQYSVAQPKGQQSPFNTNPAWTDSDSFDRDFATGQTGTFAEITGQPGKRETLTAGVREETFALTAAHTFNPRGSLAFRINSHQSVDASYDRSFQLAPAINILSFPANALLKPIQVEQISAAADLWHLSWATARIDVYRKAYSNEAVSTEYPSLMLANMVDTLGQQFVWIPLRSGGWGRSKGVELLIRAHWKSHAQFLGSTTYSSTLYAAADGVLRAGNYDFPLVGNGLIAIEFPKAFKLSVRDTYASGRPYTPFNVTLSEQQARGIYDLSRVNALRGPAYNRLDFDVGRKFRIPKGLLTVNGGMDNALDRGNFLGYAWLDRCLASEPAAKCDLSGAPEAKVEQMPHFPSGTIRYTF